jgi:two-component system, chemotaxis family, chemotaxis protein CheY
MHSNPPKIAVVDDDQIYQFIINRTLAKLHFNSKILNFPNCADFFNFLKRNSTNTDLLPDLVLLDLNTSFMNGWEFLESYEGIKSSLKKDPDIYLVSSSVDPNDLDLAEKNPNLSGFVSKPLSPEQLLEMIDKVAVK